jgi:hypothetical protein
MNSELMRGCLAVQEKEDADKESEGEEKNGKADAEKASGGQNGREKDSAKKGPGGSVGAASTAGGIGKKKKKKKKRSDHPSGPGNSGTAKKASKKDDSHGKRSHVFLQYCRIVGCQTNNKLQGICREADMAWSRYHPSICLQRLKKSSDKSQSEEAMS